MMNVTCGVWIQSHRDFYVLNNPCSHNGLAGAEIPLTTSFYAIICALSLIMAIIVHFCYNSVTVLQYRIFAPAISNNFWIAYFISVSTRTIILSIVYAKAFDSEGYVLTNWITGSFEVLILCLALDYQRRFRSVAKITVEPEDQTSEVIKVLKVFTLQEGLLVLWFILIIISIILFRYREPAVWFWVYCSLSLLLLFNAFIIGLLVCKRTGYDEPEFITKMYFVGSVLLLAPERVPVFVWKYCAHGAYNCWSEHFDLFDLFLVFKMLSLFFLFRALYKEFHRLKNECQYALLNEVQGYAFQ